MTQKRLTILHSNDLHGDFLSEEIDDKQSGGIALLSGFLKEKRAENNNVLYVVAGDMFRGSIIDSEFKGLSTVELMNYLSPDVVTIGNHEVDYGLAHLLFLEKCARFPIINANLYIKSNHARLFEPYLIKEIDGLKIMFIGVLTEEVLKQTKGEEIIGSFVDIWKVVQEIGVIIDNYKTTSVDYTVLLTHIGYQEDIKLAEILDPDLGVDLIIGGHSHTELDKPTIVNGIPIVQAGTGSKHIGKIELCFDENNSLNSFEYDLIPINNETCKKDPIVEGLLASYKNQTDRKYLRVITTFKRALTHPRRNQETELGNLFADLLQVDSSFDVMLMPSGAIRKTELGPIVTYQDLKECLPYDEAVTMLEVNGIQFRKMLRFMLRDETFNDGHTEFYQLSKGMHIVYDYQKKDFVEFKYKDKEIKDDDRLKIALTEGYHLDGFNEFFGLDIKEIIANAKPKRVMLSNFAIFEELLSLSNNVDAKIEDRIVIINK